MQEALSRTVMDYLRGNADGAGEEGEEEEELQSEDPTLPSFYAPSLWTDPGPDLWRALVFDQLDEAHLHFGDDDDAYEDVSLNGFMFSSCFVKAVAHGMTRLQQAPGMGMAHSVPARLAKTTAVNIAPAAHCNVW